MGIDRTVPSAPLEGWPSLQMADARDFQCRSLHGCHGVSVALLPKNFPPFTTVQYHFYRWRDAGVPDLINMALVEASRLVSGSDAAPGVASIDSQSVKTTESGGVCGHDAGKKVKGRKRHVITDTQGNLLWCVVLRIVMAPLT